MTKNEANLDQEIAAQIDWNIPIDPQELEQLRNSGALSLWEKLEWLEAAQRFVEQMERQRAIRQTDK